MTVAAGETSSPIVVPVDALPSATIVIPAYNEALIIMQSLNEVYTYLGTLDDEFAWEMLIVDDGSTDETGAIAELFASTRKNVRVLRHRVNFNLGQALRYAFSNCTTDYIVTVDADLSYSPDHIGRLLRHIHTTTAKVVLASPYAASGNVSNVPFRRKLLSRAANRFLSAAVKGELSTLTGMVRAYDRVFLQSLDLSSTDVGINTEIIYKARILKARVEEIPAELSWTAAEAVGRTSSLRLSATARTYVMSGFLFRPFTTFIIPAILFFIAALVTFFAISTSWLFGDRSLFEAFDGAPGSTVLGVLFVVLSIQFFSLGLMAEQSRRNFEYLFHLGTANLREQRFPQR